MVRFWLDSKSPKKKPKRILQRSNRNCLRSSFLSNSNICIMIRVMMTCMCLQVDENLGREYRRVIVEKPLTCVNLDFVWKNEFASLRPKRCKYIAPTVTTGSDSWHDVNHLGRWGWFWVLFAVQFRAYCVILRKDWPQTAKFVFGLVLKNQCAFWPEASSSSFFLFYSLEK